MGAEGDGCRIQTRSERMVRHQFTKAGDQLIKGWFLGWGIDTWINNMNQSCPVTMAIIEWPNGEVQLVSLNDFRFIT